MLNWYFIFRILGFILCLEAFFLFLAAGLSFYYGEWEAQFILVSGIITLLFGAFFVSMGPKTKAKNVGKRESFMAVSLSWIVFSLFGMLPFCLTRAIPSVTDAFFETMSGLTTTGSTILTCIERLPKGLLFWRSLLQWLGGMGMILFSLALLPLLGGGAVQLYDAETTGITHDKFRPRVTQIAKRLWGIYLVLTLILTALLYLGPMNFFDALCHALSTMSTGGFSTKQASIAYWGSAYIEYVICVFMLIGSINFTLIYFLFTRKFKRVLKDEELKWYLIIIAGATLVIAVLLVKDVCVRQYALSFRVAIFQVISFISTCGFVTSDFVSWGPFYWVVFLLLMLVCGCAGSTSGGMKIIRLVVLAKNTRNEFRKHLHPRAIVPVRINGTALSPDVVQRVMSFVFLYMVIILFSWIFFSLTGMGFEESLGASITAIGNAGPGLGNVGPSSHFACIPALAKWYMAFLMMVGRLEIFTVLTLFTSGFWKKM
ncbi:MAG: TrkH family potassium uptake protein [Dysgonamonadaceae bacterium]|nr:TrkH family potassium uptake protein [Dysgonamonadaceae bacterium]